MIERQELRCHACGRYVQFDMDLSFNGNHVLDCPNCGHEHCRVVKDGQITSIRWDLRNGPNIFVPIITASTSSNSTFSTYDINGGTSSFTYGAWSNTTTGNVGSTI